MGIKMTTRAAVSRFIVESDPGNGGPISYSANNINAEFASECLGRNEFSDGSEIDETQRLILQAVADGREFIEIPE